MSLQLNFRQVALHWTLWGLSFTLYDGGATWHFQQHASVDATAEIARWSSVKTCRIYVQAALLELSNMAKQNSSLLLDKAKCIIRILKHPLRC